MAQTTMRGADAVVKVLLEEKVETVFGIPGGQMIPIYDALYDSPIRNVLVRHEQGGAHMADGVSRSTGKVGVCLATSGPGALNLVTGIATAYMDSVPMVAITGQVTRPTIGRDSFQEADTTGVTIPVTKHNYLVSDETKLVDTLREAFYLANTGRPGPVLVDIPGDVARAQVPYPERCIECLDGYEEPLRPVLGDIEQAADMINRAERPLLYIGGGVISAGASDLVLALSTKCNLAVVHTLMGKGGFPESHELSMGMPGMHGMAYASHALHECDLMVVIGARFDDRVTGDLKRFSPGTSVIHIDIDAAEIGKVRSAHVPIVSDARAALEALLPLCHERGRTEWEAHLLAMKAAMPLQYSWDATGMPPQYVVQKLREVAGAEAIITTEVGQNQMWAAQYYSIEHPRKFLSSSGLGTMGYGFPAAIGAQFANPGAVVVDIAGDGSVQMNIQEMATAMDFGLPVKVCILNNGYLGMVRQWQDLFFSKRYSGVELSERPDWVKLAEAYGAVGLRASDPDQVVAAMEQAMEVTDRPCIMDFRVSREENVFPMIPAGQAIDDIMMDAGR